MSLARGARSPASGSRARASSSTRRSSTRPGRNVDCFDDVPATAALYLDPDGTPRDVGTTLRNPDLARDVRADRAARRDALLPRRDRPTRSSRPAQHPPIAPTRQPRLAAGRHDDAATCARYRAIERAPTHVATAASTSTGMGPPSSGGSTVGEALNILEGYRPARRRRAQALHRCLEASRLAFADRGAYLADPAFVDVPLRGLLSEEFAATRRALITETAPRRAPSRPAIRTPFDTAAGRARQRGDQRPAPVDDAHHRRRHARQRRLVHVHDRVDGRHGDRRARLRLPAQQRADGLQLRLARRIRTASRAASARAARWRPTIVLRDGKPLLALGSPGGSTIITTVLQMLLDRLDLGMTLPQAIARRARRQRNAPTTSAEPAFLRRRRRRRSRRAGTRSTRRPRSAPRPGSSSAGGRTLAAAEPVRRGGGSAAVVEP